MAMMVPRSQPMKGEEGEQHKNSGILKIIWESDS